MEEVLDSLRLRISAMFKWAKGEVKGFDDLSPLDQKALLRRTVAELVMLGFAKASIGFNGTQLHLFWTFICTELNWLWFSYHFEFKYS